MACGVLYSRRVTARPRHLPAFAAFVHRQARYRSLCVLLLLFWSSVACRRSSQPEESKQAASSATAMVSASAKPVASTQWPPPKPPTLPPQLVACGERDFYRIDQHTLQVFEVAKVIPPPNIRGSRVARQTTEVDIAGPENVVSLAKKRVLVIAKDGLLRYEFGDKEARRYRPIAAPGPVVAWADPRESDAFWLRVQAEKSVRKYVLASPAEPGAKSPKAATKPGTVIDGVVEPLTDFDSRLFTVLTDGTPFYSTPQGLRRLGDSSEPRPFPALSKPPTILFADPTPNRYWAADSSGALALWDLKGPEAPVFSSRVPGVVIDVATQGEEVAVLSMELAEASYRSTLTIFSKGKQQGRLSIAPSVAAHGQPKLDVCLLAGRPWAVVGGRHWLQLLDWTAPRLLAEW